MQNHRQYTLHLFAQFGALYMHSSNDKHPTRPGFETSTCEFRAKTRLNKPSRLARIIKVDFIPAVTYSSGYWFGLQGLHITSDLQTESTRMIFSITMVIDSSNIRLGFEYTADLYSIGD